MTHMGPTPCQFNTWNYQVFINIKKYKIMLEIPKDYLRIIFFLMAVKDHSFKQVQKYARLRKQ